MESPQIDTTARVCGHCGTKTIFKVLATVTSHIQDEDYTTTTRLLQCYTCSGVTLEENTEFWQGDEQWSVILYPILRNDSIPSPTKDMPANIALIYDEAYRVFPHSPRASAALLRLAIQELCRYLGKSGKNLNEDIRELVKDGLSPRIQQALDSVRVIGNNAVHPGYIDWDNDWDINIDQDTPLEGSRNLVETLFKLVNFIVEEMITKPREIKEIYNHLPQNQLEQIEQRQNKA